MDDIDHVVAADKPRALARRRQVLDAANRCFRRHGFHSCSMAQISAEAGMSVGHIYRYFTGKEQIISAIVREDVDELLAKVAQFPTHGPDLRGALTQLANDSVWKTTDPESVALMLEIFAEASRNPAIGELVRHADAKISVLLRPMLAAAVGRPLEPADLEARLELFHLIFQGIGLRAVANPALGREELARMVDLAIDGVLK
jgi:AcrR family transcriptional regulator